MYRKKFKRALTSTKKILTAFLKSKRATIGLGIILFFCIIAIAAPILTPYDPTQSKYLSGTRAVPIWMRYLPGGEKLSENLFPAKDPNFKNANVRQNWNLATSSPYITFEYVAGIGDGSLGVIFSRKSTQTPQISETKITFHFNYPYKGPPDRFEANVKIFVEDASGVPIQPTFFITDETNNKTYTWGFGSGWKDENITSTATQAITPFPPIHSAAELSYRRERFGTEQELSSLIFPETANYTFGLNIIFWDNPSLAGKNVKAIVYVDTMELKLYGTAFGLLGTTWEGADVFTQLIYGARISLIVGLLASIISVLIGLIVGLVSGFLGGVIDEALMRINDALLVLPGLPLLIVLIAVLGARLHVIILVLGFLGWMGFARVVRSQVLSLKERPFIEAAKAVGAGTGHIIFKHIVPNVMGLVYVTLATSVPGAIVGEAALSWLGYYDPYVISWGRMLNEVQMHNGYTCWWWIIPPGLCIAALSIAFVLLGYALDEILNPRLRVRR
jgi:peptide/nickel transport system permease protein